MKIFHTCFLAEQGAGETLGATLTSETDNFNSKRGSLELNASLKSRSKNNPPVKLNDKKPFEHNVHSLNDLSKTFYQKAQERHPGLDSVKLVNDIARTLS